MLSNFTIGSSESENLLKFSFRDLGEPHIPVESPETHSALTNLGVVWGHEISLEEASIVTML